MSAMNAPLAIGYLHQCLDFCCEEGTLIWKHRPLAHFSSTWYQKWWNRHYAGKIANSTKGLRRLSSSILLDEQRFKVQNIVWAMSYGRWPTSDIVFVDGNQQNLTLSNLAAINSYLVDTPLPKERGFYRRIKRQDQPSYTHKKFVHGKPTFWYLNQCLTYNPNTGQFFWKERPVDHFPDTNSAHRWNGRLAGKLAGSTITCCGQYQYHSIGLGGTSFLAHRLAWTMYYGVNPHGIVLHLNGDTLNNRIENLQLVN